MGRQKLLTSEQVLEVVQRWIIHHGVAPTVEGLRRSLGVASTRTVMRYLRQLEDEGYIERWHGARGLKLLKSVGGGIKTRAVPLVGDAPAGPLMLAEENLQGWVRLPESFLSPGFQFFLLRVRGNSMNLADVAGDRVENGDLVPIRFS